MANTPIDRLVEVLGLVDGLREAVVRHDRAIDRIVTDQQDILARLERLETRLARLEDDAET